MSDARDAFHNLQVVAGTGLNKTEIYADRGEVERRITRHRAGRAVLSSVAALVIVGGVTFAAVSSPFRGASPAVPPSLPSAVDLRSEACNEAHVVAGKSVGNVGGMEGWFNSAPEAPCNEWSDQVLDHPDTVLIYTGDNTMVEAYYRTSIDALGAYASLGAGFVVPDPDPAWPADSLVLLDARTDEVLETTALADLADVPSPPAMSVFGEPYPAGFPAPELVDLVPGGQGGSYLSETDTTYTFGLLRPDPTNGDTVEVPVTFPKGNILVMAATDWECSWINEYVWAAQAGDTERTATAAAQVRKFPDLEVIQTYNPELGQGHRTVVDPRIAGGDIEFAKRWLNGSCAGA